ncbi:MAG: HTTM domain-containing protein, partial [Myxococcales bacterium]|nr:HTTM domain-containing protein [Myxococcales bacterium]
MATDRDRLLAFLRQPQDASKLETYRLLFGTLMVFSTVRFIASGWVESIYLEPTYHFTYLGFGWIRPWPRACMYVHLVVQAAAALCFALRIRPRLSISIFFVLFTYAELIEKAAYLNHYYFVSLMAFLLIWMPWGQAKRTGSVPRCVYWFLLAQVAIVYFYAGAAKLGADWLFEGQPLHLWLQAYQELPLVGRLAGSRQVAIAMSWAGALFDLTIWAWLLWKRSRPFAVAAGIFFHVFVWVLFPIGVFSWVMIANMTLFFEPDWRRRLLEKLGLGNRTAPYEQANDDATARPTYVRWLLWFGAAWLVVQLALPLRHWAYPGDVNWSEQGFRFAWRVMLIDKVGSVEYRVSANELD